MSDAALRVIQKLLSRAESTDFESERESCLAKVGELMVRHSIEEALLRSADSTPATERPTERLLVVPSPYAARKVSLFGAVGEHCGCTVIDIGAEPDGVRRVAAVGYPRDLERMELLTTSLLVQLTRALLAESPDSGGHAGATAAPRRTPAPRRHGGEASSPGSPLGCPSVWPKPVVCRLHRWTARFVTPSIAAVPLWPWCSPTGERPSIRRCAVDTRT